MSYWDSSALVKLYVKETDFAQFQGLTAPGVPLVIARIAHYEAHAVLADFLPSTVLRTGSHHDIKYDLGREAGEEEE